MTGRLALVTGANRGIGFEVARQLIEREWSVWVTARDPAKAEAAAEKLGRSALPLALDVTDSQSIENAFCEVSAGSETIHIAFNIAGVVFGRGSLTGNAPLADVDLQGFDDVWSTNTRGMFSSMKEEIPVMLGNEAWGRYGLKGVIINNASVSAHGVFPGIGPYSVSKHGVLGLTRGAALDYGKDGLRIVLISPGGVDTPMRRASIEAQGRDPDENPAPNVQHRTNTSEEMADVVMYLASPNAPSSIHGTDIDVTMGMLTGPFAPPAA
ncbi:SDR family NAD(P)-dependent oxidoreductase [Parvularcula maris]|uniref:SDR family oxidoreductase n=1 Tax=Parvularcula maris TaxID=2965077 RepID=A0A9X2LBH2_9PROT|nr:SDR family oxidoreductase [Parvularcula maris]MCQ8186620.1 SDR family oxidoreductase [Parvularcula maris]